MSDTNGSAAADKVTDFEWYEPHPLLGMFPGAAEPDLQAMALDVARVGVQQQLVLWKGPRGLVFLIDGRTRQDAARRAFLKAEDEERPPLADTGVSLQPDVFWFEGSQDDVYAFVKRTHMRKHFSPGQKAAMGVRLYYYELKQRHRLTELPTTDQELALAGSAAAEELAARYGTNHYYVGICKALYREAVDLLDACAMGVIPPSKARATLEQRRNSAAGGPTDPGDADSVGEGSDPEPPGDPDVVRDAKGREVPEWVADSFRSRSGYLALERTLQQAERQGSALAAAKGGEFLDLPLLLKTIGSARKHAKGVTPDEVCPDCTGRGRVKGQKGPCKSCRGHGYSCKLIRRQLKQAAKSESAPAVAE